MREKLLLRALGGQTCERPPFWFMRQAGRYLPEYQALRAKQPDFLKFCYTPELTVEATLQPLRRFGMDAAILFSDILVIPDALGQRVTFVEGMGPVLEPIGNAGDIGVLAVEKLDNHLAPVYQAVVVLRDQLPEKTSLIGFAGAPWTLAVYMVEGRGGAGCHGTSTWAYRDPVTFASLIDLLVRAAVQHLSRQIEHGCNAIQLFDSWAGVLSETEFRRWVIAPTAEIVRCLKQRHGAVPVIGFPRGAGVLYDEYVEKTGVDAVSIDSSIPVQWARSQLQRRCAVQGNLDNHALVAGGQALTEETRRILDVLAEGPFIFNLGHGVLPETPPEHVQAVSEQVRNWRSKRPK
jgi:uroporphyrinogen decarboxylase